MDLKEYLDKYDIKVCEFAETMFVHSNTVTNWIHWHTMPSKKMMERIEIATDGKVTPKDLMYYWETKRKYG